MISHLASIIEKLRELAHEEYCDPDSMSHGYGRALTDAANLLGDLLKAEIDAAA